MRPSTGSTRSTLLSLSLLLSPSLAHPAILDGPHGGHSGGAGGGGAYGALLEGIDLNAISSIISPFIPGLDLSVLKDIDFKNLNYTRLAPLVSTVSSFLGTAADTGMLVGLASGFIPPLAKSNVVDLTPALNRTGSKRIKVRLGPLTLLGKDEYSKKPAAFSKGSFMSLDPHGQSYINTFPAQSLCTNCTILAGASSLEFEDGSPADPDHGVYIHHILSADITRWGTTTILPCDVPDKDVDTIAKTFKMLAPSAFLGRAEDNGRDTVLFTSRDGNFNSGFHLTDKNTFLLQTDFVNYNNDTKKVFVTFDIEYVDGITGQEASTNLLSVVGCGAGEPKVNMTGVAVTESKKFPILMDGTIIALKGHLHNGGEKMVLYLNDQEICTSLPTYDKNNGIVKMSTCDSPIKIKKGDTISMKSVYDVVKHPMRADSMGGMSHNIGGGNDVMGMWTMSVATEDGTKRLKI